MKKILSTIVVFAVVLNIFVLPTTAASAQNLPFDEYIIKSLLNFEKTIDITSYVTQNKWDKDDISDAYFDVILKNPQIFFVNTEINIRTTRSSTKTTYDLTNIKYTTTKAQYEKSAALFEQATENALKNVNQSMSDLEKALALHDYLVLNVKYDTTLTKATAYDALVGKTAVCQGYALAYVHLLRQVGVESVMISSDPMNHAWNYVKLGSNWYHVDVTSDDPLFGGKTDMYGRVNHTFFMLSDSAIAALGHNGWDRQSLPKAAKATYDDYFWKDITSPITKLGDYWYYIEYDLSSPSYNQNYRTNPTSDPYYTSIEHIYRYSFDTKKRSKVHTMKSTWFTWGTENTSSKGWWDDIFAGMVQYNGKLYFNDAKSIYCYNPTTKKVTTAKTPADINGYIYGLNIKDNVITYVIKQKPNDQGTLKNLKLSAATATKITFSYKNKTSLAISAGKSFTPTATLTPSKSKDYIYYESSDTSIAKVDQTGKVTAKKAGKCKITAYTANGKSASITLTVK